MDFFVPSFKLLLFHIATNSPDFLLSCGINLCTATFSNFQAFRRHLHKKHRSVAIEHEANADGDFLQQGQAVSYIDGGDESLEHTGLDMVKEWSKIKLLPYGF